MRRTTIEAAPGEIRDVVDGLAGHVGIEVRARAYRTANELQNQVNYVLRGQRHGRRYKIPGSYKRQMDKASGKMRNGRYYTASAPGEPPAVRTGAFRASWHRGTSATSLDGHNVDVKGFTESRLRAGKYLLGELLENGTGRMAPRPYKARVVERALPKVQRIYREPYFR